MTLVMVKPDGVRKQLIGEVVRRFEMAGLKVVAMKMTRLTREQAEGFYAVHREKEFFPSLVRFMTSGPVVAMALAGDGAIEKVRGIMGATDPAKAEAGTIRRLHADSVEQNIVHGSDAPETAHFEVAYFFNSLEMCEAPTSDP